MTPATLVAATPAGGRLYAAIDPTMPVGRIGALAHSATIAALVPFADRDGATAALLRLGIPAEAIAETL